MPEYIIRFPGDWYLRGTIATGDIRRADYFKTEAEARKALDTVKRHFKTTHVDAIEVVKIGE